VPETSVASFLVLDIVSVRVVERTSRYLEGGE
jgi:hypothetical protein